VCLFYCGCPQLRTHNGEAVFIRSCIAASSLRAPLEQAVSRLTERGHVSGHRPFAMFLLPVNLYVVLSGWHFEVGTPVVYGKLAR
jgi:hypothetical protein